MIRKFRELAHVLLDNFELFSFLEETVYLEVLLHAYLDRLIELFFVHLVR